ncbi:MAG: SCP2 sterol-binding domain-containing protein [Candidatus Hermodarchaeota archaeon]
MPKFATQEWAEAYVSAINNNPSYMEAAGPSGFPPNGWEGDFIFEIEPSGPVTEKITMWIGLYHGECTGAKILDASQTWKLLKPGEKPSGGTDYEVEFVYSAKYDSWVKILKKELDPIRALLSGQAKLQGDMAKVMRATKAAQELVVSTTTFDTEFW